MLDKPCIYLFFPTRLINSIKHEHSCEILYLLLLPLCGGCFGSFFCGVVLNVLSSFAIILMRKRELVASIVVVLSCEWLCSLYFLAVWWIESIWSVIVACPGHTHLYFFYIYSPNTTLTDAYKQFLVS